MNKLLIGYAERFIFKEGDVIYNRDRGVSYNRREVEGLNIKYIIKNKTKNYMKVYKCIGWYSIPLKNVIDVSKNECRCLAGCTSYNYLVHYKQHDYEETGHIRRLVLNSKKYFIYKYKDHLVCCEMDTKPVRRNLRYTDVMDEYITTKSKYMPIYAKTHVLTNVDEIVNDMDIQTTLNM